MLLDAVLATAHHLVAIALACLLVAEIVIVRVHLTPPVLRGLSQIDGWLGILVMAIGLVGVARVLWGVVPGDYYLYNWLFWTKMAFLSILSFWLFVPGIPIQRWEKHLREVPDYEPPAREVVYVRRMLWVELALLVPVPVAAALMARGYGAF